MVWSGIGIVVGGLLGLVVSRNLSRFTGGVCPILCNPKLAIPYFAFIGFLIAQEILH